MSGVSQPGGRPDGTAVATRHVIAHVACALAVGWGCSSTPAPPTGACVESVAAYCAGEAPGTCLWPGPTPSADQCPHTLLSTRCGAYEAVLLQGVDTATLRYHDRSTGALVAVIHSSAVFRSRTCEAGPPDGFAEPTCDPSSFTPSCPDAGL